MSDKIIFLEELAKTLIEEQEAAMAIIGNASTVMVVVIVIAIILITGFVDQIEDYIGDLLFSWIAGFVIAILLIVMGCQRGVICGTQETFADAVETMIHDEIILDANKNSCNFKSTDEYCVELIEELEEIKKLTREDYITKSLLVNEGEESIKEDIKLCEEKLSNFNDCYIQTNNNYCDAEKECDDVSNRIEALEKELSDLKNLSN